jgi:hypothetical protein
MLRWAPDRADTRDGEGSVGAGKGALGAIAAATRAESAIAVLDARMVDHDGGALDGVSGDICDLASQSQTIRSR